MPEEDVFNDDIEVAADIPENPIVNEYLSKISIGDVETLAFGEDAYVTNTGTEENPVLNFGLPRGASGTIWGQLDGLLSDQTDLQEALDAKDTAIATKADANNAILTGTPTAPTAISSTNNTQIATTAFVQNAISILNTNLTNYINSAVANVLKNMNYNDAVSISIPYASGTSRIHTYTAPSNGYLIGLNPVTPNKTYTEEIDDVLTINGKDILAFRNINHSSNDTINNNIMASILPVSAGDIISHKYQSSKYIGISFTFVPMR